MSGPQDDDGRDIELWRRFSGATGRPAPEGVIDPGVLAAYVDGAALPEEVEAVESAMAADASLVDAVADLRDALAGGPTEVPEPVRARLRAALSAAAADAGGRAAPPVLRAAMPWYARLTVAAAVLIASFLGYEVGRYGAGAETDQGEAIGRELAPELGHTSIQSGLLAAFESADDWNGGGP